MSEYKFIRKYRLVIGEANTSDKTDKKSVVITEQHVEFDTQHHQGSKPDTMEIKIFNLSRETIAIFDKKDVLVSLYVGYGDDELVLLFRGNKTFMETTKSNTEVITRVLVADGYVSIREGRAHTTQPEGANVEQVIRGIISDSMPEITNINMNGATLKRIYNSGYAVNGNATTALNTICSANGLIWNISENNTINVFPIKGSIKKEAIVISPNDGLINTVEKTNQDIKALKKDIDAPEDAGIKFKMLMNPLVKAGQLISIQGTFATDGVYKVKTATHSGSYEGTQWETSIEAESTNYQTVK
jgi:hypothetical protein